ncbi:unnamed protein product [Rhizoctonia solani]|uniref:Uncharacterized protein n=1 Tax=Rhizoctonia solani TaxID=456999 RepID=A0A8H3CJK5_9AGAM|nr:unnamed protein product [Rhizoctonia solani]
MIMGIIVAFVLSLLCYHFYCPRQVADRVSHLYWFCRRALYVAGKNIASKIWRLELLGNGAVSEMREETTNESTELLQLQGELSIANQELSELHSLLYKRDETIQQLEQDLKSKEEILGCAGEEPTNLHNQHILSESKKQTDIASLQAKMDRMEYLMSQMISKPGGNT